MTQLPSRHTHPDPQAVPSGRFARAGHVGVADAEAHAVEPVRHASPGVHACPATQAGTHAPEAHTLPLPQPTSSGATAPVSMHDALPPEQSIAPRWHGLAGTQVAPAVQSRPPSPPPAEHPVTHARSASAPADRARLMVSPLREPDATGRPSAGCPAPGVGPAVGTRAW